MMLGSTKTIDILKYRDIDMNTDRKKKQKMIL